MNAQQKLVVLAIAISFLAPSFWKLFSEIKDYFRIKKDLERSEALAQTTAISLHEIEMRSRKILKE